jgi:signal transduction histidine kinase
VEELIGHSVLDIFHEDDKNMVVARLTDCLRTPDIIQEWEFRKVRKDGCVIWVRETARVGQSFTGETVVLVTCEDITDRKRMEDVLRQRERDLRAAVEEREQISQDLHDGILQSLFAVGLVLESTKSRMSPRTRKTSGTPLDQAITQLNRVMHEIRNFIAGLGSDLLEGKDLPRALKQMLDSLSQTHATRVRLAVEARVTRSLSAEQSLHLFHVIQEAVSNCIRHGRAQEATVSLKMLKQGIRLSIRDNGAGFNPKAVRHEGHGLTNMAARAKKIGARFSVFSKINEGTRVVVNLPKEAALDLH